MKRTPRSCRLEEDIEVGVEEWLSRNPDVGWTMLVNMAVRKFISSTQELVPVGPAKVSEKKHQRKSA